MRYLQRTAGVHIGWLFERFQSDYLDLRYEESAKMAADIFTKAFTDQQKWKDVCRLVNIADRDEFYDHISSARHPPAGGGVFFLD